jgi:hypothetical protein
MLAAPEVAGALAGRPRPRAAGCTRHGHRSGEEAAWRPPSNKPNDKTDLRQADVVGTNLAIPQGSMRRLISKKRSRAEMATNSKADVYGMAVHLTNGTAWLQTEH